MVSRKTKIDAVLIFLFISLAPNKNARSFAQAFFCLVLLKQVASCAVWFVFSGEAGIKELLNNYAEVI